MTKLTTEITIEELQYRIHAHESDLTQMWTADYFLNVQKELLALKQAAKNPVAFVDERSAASGGICWAKSGKRELPHGTELYAAPVLPKQPESEIPFGDVEPIEVTDDMVYAFHNRLSDGSLTSDEFTDIKQGLCAALMNIPRPAQSVIPEQRQMVPDEIIPDQDNTYDYVGGWNACRAEMLKAQQNEPQNIPAQPVIPEQRECISFDALMAAVSEVTGVKREFDATPDKCHQILPVMNFNSLSRIVEMFRTAQLVRLAYKLPNKVTAQDMRETFNYLMSEEEAQAAANGFNQCLLESNKLTNERDWIKGQFAYQDLFNAIGAAVVSKHPSIEISVKAFEDSMLAAAPAQESE